MSQKYVSPYSYNFGPSFNFSSQSLFTPAYPVQIVFGDISENSSELTPVKQSKIKRGNAEGYECGTCKDFNPMADLNMPEDSKDPTYFICYGCRKGLITVFRD